MNINRHIIGYSATAVLALIIGGGLGNAAVAEKPAKVITTIKTVDVPGHHSDESSHHRDRQGARPHHHQDHHRDGAGPSASNCHGR